jgi:hypothetical protein
MKKTNYFLIKPFFVYRNHYEMIPPTVELLKNDGIKDIYDFLNSTNPANGKKYLTLIAKGTKDADIPWSGAYILHLYHFHHPWTHRGYLFYKSAADQLAGMFTAGQNFWTHGKKDRALYELGRMLHLVQDIFIPHHAGVTAKRGHGDLEKWLGSNWHLYTVEKGGYYSWEKTFENSADAQIHTVSSKNPYDWIDIGSHISISWYQKYFQNYEAQNSTYLFPGLASKIIPFTLRYSAGFINRFFIGLTL